MKGISPRVGAITIVTLMILILIPPFSTSASSLSEFGTGCSVNLPSSGDYNAIAIGDINGDSIPDIAFGGNDYGSSSTYGISVYLGNGDGTWTSSSSGLPTVDSWGGMAFADADGDGHMELYAGNTFYNSHDGSIQGLGAWEYSSGSWSTSGITSPQTTGVVNNVAVEDITGDDGLDMVICSSKQPSFGLKVFTGSGSSPIEWTDFSAGLPTSGQFTSVDILDMNGDGLSDMVASGYWSGTGLRLYLQTDAGWMDASDSLPSSAYSGDMMGVALGDVDSDGHADIVYNELSRGIYIFLGNSGGGDGSSFTWAAPTTDGGGIPSSASSGTFSQIHLEDIDLDGDLDLLAPKDSSGLHLYLGNGNTVPGDAFEFTEAEEVGLPSSGTYYGSAFIDFDSDGDLDIAGATWGNGVTVHETVLASDAPDDQADTKQGDDVLSDDDIDDAVPEDDIVDDGPDEPTGEVTADDSDEPLYTGTNDNTSDDGSELMAVTGIVLMIIFSAFAVILLMWHRKKDTH